MTDKLFITTTVTGKTTWCPTQSAELFLNKWHLTFGSIWNILCLKNQTTTWFTDSDLLVSVFTRYSFYQTALQKMWQCILISRVHKILLPQYKTLVFQNSNVITFVYTCWLGPESGLVVVVVAAVLLDTSFTFRLFIFWGSSDLSSTSSDVYLNVGTLKISLVSKHEHAVMISSTWTGEISGVNPASRSESAGMGSSPQANSHRD